MRKSLKSALVVLGCLLPFAIAQATPLTDIGTKAVMQSANNIETTGVLMVPVIPMAEPSAFVLLAVDLLSAVAVTFLVRKRASR